MAHAPTEKTWRKITRDDRAKDQSGHARPGRSRILKNGFDARPHLLSSPPGEEITIERFWFCE
jgi:hypothetical protein